MGRRPGLSPRGEATRRRILDAALEIIARDGYGGATIKVLAETVGLSQNGILHYFESKESLFTEIIQLHERRFAAETDSDIELVAGVADVVRRNAALPGFVQLYSRLSNEATDHEHPAHEHFRRHYEVTRRTTADAFRRLQEEGRIDPGHDPETLASLLWAVSDGMQTQWLFDPGIDLPEHVVCFLRLIGLDAEQAGAGQD